MAITRSTAAKNASADAVVDLIDLGTTNPNGQLIFQASDNSEVATLNFSDPAFGAASSGTATANAITDDTNATGGTTDNFKVVDRDGNTVFTGTVTSTGGGGDVEMDNNTISAGTTVSRDTLTYTAT